MDYTKAGLTSEMVKMTLKRAANSPDNKIWVCKRIDDDPKLKRTKETADGPSGSLSMEVKKLNEDSENWYEKIPSYLQIEMKEVENSQTFLGSSAKNKDKLGTQQPTHSHGTADSTGNSCNDPIDLSGSNIKNKSRRDMTNVSHKSPIGDFRKNSLTGPDEVAQYEVASPFPSAIRTQSTFPFANQMPMHSGEVAMAKGAMPSLNQNYHMANNGDSTIASGFVNSHKSEILVKGNTPNHLQQETSKFLKQKDSHFSKDAHNYGFPNNVPISDESKCNRPSVSESKAHGHPIKYENGERMQENLANNLPQKPVSSSHPKRFSQTSAQTGSNEALKSECPPKKKKSHAEFLYTENPCNVYDPYKTNQCFGGHVITEKHLGNINQVGQQQPNFHNFQSNSVIRPSLPIVSNFQLQPHPYFLHLMRYQMWYHQMLQVRAMTAAYQSDGRAIINSIDAQKINAQASMPDCKEVSLNRNKSTNDLETKRYSQDPNLQAKCTSNTQSSFLLPKGSQSENSPMENPQKSLGNKAPQSKIPQPDPSSQIRPENSSILPSMAKSDSCAINTVQPKSLTEAGSFQELGYVQSISYRQLEFFRVYHCLVCSKFHTDDLQELEQHVSINRNKIPFETITASGNELYCKLCDFKTLHSVEMFSHCDSKSHLSIVDCYNHFMEGGAIETEEMLRNLHLLSPISLLCSACEFATKSMDTLKTHKMEPSHKHNVLFCTYASKFSPEVEYCYCRPCGKQSPTKRELLLHVRSNKHMAMLQKFSIDEKLLVPEYFFFIKESSLKIMTPRVSHRTEDSTFMMRENPHLRKENNEDKDITENGVLLDLRTAPSTSKKRLPIYCYLCQLDLPEINALVHHLQQTHDVNEAGVNWIISTATKVHEEESIPTEDLSNKKAGNLKSVAFSQQKSDISKTLPIQGLSTSSPPYKSSRVARQNPESKYCAVVKAIASEQNMAMDVKLNKSEKSDKDSSSSRVIYEMGCSKNLKKLRQRVKKRTGKDNPSIQSCETGNKQNPRSRTYSLVSHHFYEKEGTWNSGQPDFKLDLNRERINVDPSSSHRRHETEIRKKKVSDSEENLNSNFSQARIGFEDESESNGYKYDIKTDRSSSDQFSETVHGLPMPQSDLNARRKRSDCLLSNHNPSQQFCKTESMVPLGEEKVPKLEKILKTVAEKFSSERISAVESPVHPLDDNTKREKINISSSAHNLVAHERSTIKVSSISKESQISQLDINASRESDSLSSDNSVINEPSPSADYSKIEIVLAPEHESPKSQSGLRTTRKRKHSYASHNCVDYELMSAIEENARANSSPSQRPLLDSENTSPVEDQHNLNLKKNIDCYFLPVTGLKEPKEADDKNMNDSTNSRKILYDYPNDYEAEFSGLNFPTITDPQIQAGKNVENIEISNVISLASYVESSNNTDEEEKSLDFEGMVLPHWRIV